MARPGEELRVLLDGESLGLRQSTRSGACFDYQRLGFLDIEELGNIGRGGTLQRDDLLHLKVVGDEFPHREIDQAAKITRSMQGRAGFDLLRDDSRLGQALLRGVLASLVVSPDEGYEREVTLGDGQSARLRLTRAGPPVVDIDACLAAAREAGFFSSGPRIGGAPGSPTE